MRIGFLAPEGTFTWETAQIVAKQRGWFEDAETEFVPYPLGEDVVAAVDRGEVQYGVVAVATSLAGERGLLRAAVDAVARVRVVDECQRVCHYTLMARPGATLEGIGRIQSVQKAIDDCAGWLRKQLPRAEYVQASSTGAGAEAVAAQSSLTVAAIAPPAAAERHGLITLASNIEDDPENWTRWLVIQHAG